jgi:hypothetical protein
VRPLTAKPGSVVSDKRLPHHLRHSQSQQSTPNTKRGRSKTPKGVCVIPPIAQRQPLQVRPLTAKPGSVVPHERLPRHLHLSSLPEQDCPKLQVEEASETNAGPKANTAPDAKMPRKPKKPTKNAKVDLTTGLKTRRQPSKSEWGKVKSNETHSAPSPAKANEPKHV